MTFEERLARPTITSVLLLEVTAAVPLEAWTPFNAIWQHALPASLRLVSLELDGTALTQAASVADVEANAATWIQAHGFVYLNPPSGTPFAAPVVGFAKFHFGDSARTLNDEFYDPRLKTVPKLSLRIEPRFGGVAQIGGGQLALDNTDGFFEALAGVVRWDNGAAVLRLGLDLPDSRMDYADYRIIGTWSLDGADATDGLFKLSVKERKTNLREKIPTATYTRETYPQLAQDLIGKPIPTIYGRVYGAKPALIDPNALRLKVCSHPVRGFIGLRKQENRERTETRAPDWFQDTGLYRTAFSGSVINVKCNGADVTKVDSTEAVAATANTWHQRDNFLYLNPPVGLVASPANTTVHESVSYDLWTEIPFATKDAAHGEFTVSAGHWDSQQELAVDVIGKTDADGEAMENAADIVADILAGVGETDLDAASFAQARAYFDLGTDRYGHRLTVLRPSLLLSEPEEALAVLNRINELCGTFLHVNAQGRWVFAASHPEPGQGLPEFSDVELFQWEREEDTESYTACEVRYAQRHQEQWTETVTVRSERLRRFAGKPIAAVRQIEAAFWHRRDALYLAQRVLSTEGSPLVLYRARLPRLGFVLAPGDTVIVRRKRGSLHEICEVIEMDWDLAAKQVSLVLGNLRGWGRSCGFWMEDVPSWDQDWSDDTARDYAAASGFWTDENGFADPTDARSFHVSRWW